MQKVKVIMLDHMITIRELPEYFEKEMDKRNYMIHVAPGCFTLEDSQDNEIELLARDLPARFSRERADVIRECSRYRYCKSLRLHRFHLVDMGKLYPKALTCLGLEQSDLEGDAIIFCLGDKLNTDAVDLLTLMVRHNKPDALVEFIYDDLGKSTKETKDNIKIIMGIHQVTEEELAELDKPTDGSGSTMRGFNQLANRLVESRGLWNFGYLLKVACIFMAKMKKT